MDEFKPFPFLDLPRSVQELVYDKLQIEDRIMLNAAVAKHTSFRKTLKTDVMKDKYLSIIRYKTKVQRSKRAPVILTALQMKFVDENKRDPTIRRFLRESTFEKLSVAMDLAIPPVLLKHIRSNSVSPTLTYPFDYDKMTNNDVTTVLGVICDFATPATVIALYRNVSTTNIAKFTLFGGELALQRFSVALLNAGNSELFEYVINGCRPEFNIFTGGTKEYLAQAANNRFHNNAVARRLLLKHVPLSAATKRKMLESVMNNMDTEGFDELMAHGARL